MGEGDDDDDDEDEADNKNALGEEAGVTKLNRESKTLRKCSLALSRNKSASASCSLQPTTRQDSLNGAMLFLHLSHRSYGTCGSVRAMGARVGPWRAEE